MQTGIRTVLLRQFYLFEVENYVNQCLIPHEGRFLKRGFNCRLL